MSAIDKYTFVIGITEARFEKTAEQQQEKLCKRIGTEDKAERNETKTESELALVIIPKE